MLEETTNTFTGGTELQDTIACARLGQTRKKRTKFMNLAVTHNTANVIVGFKFHGKVTSSMQTRAMMRPQKASDDIYFENCFPDGGPRLSHCTQRRNFKVSVFHQCISDTISGSVKSPTAHADAKRHVYVYTCGRGRSVCQRSPKLSKKRRHLVSADIEWVKDAPVKFSS